MAISNVEAGTTAMDSDIRTRTHRNDAKNRHSKSVVTPPPPSNLTEEAATVSISEDGKQLQLKLSSLNIDEFNAYFNDIFNDITKIMPRTPFISSQISIYHALEGKVEDPSKLANQLSNMFDIKMELNRTYRGFELQEIRAENREAAKKLAEYIAQNYFDDPDEAKAFMDTINRYANTSEMEDDEWLKPWVDSELAQRAANIAAGKPEFHDYGISGVKPKPIEDFIAEYKSKAKLTVQNMSIEALLAKYSISLAKKAAG